MDSKWPSVPGLEVLEIALEHVDLSGAQAVLGGFGGLLLVLLLLLIVGAGIREEMITRKLELGGTANDLAVGVNTQGAQHDGSEEDGGLVATSVGGVGRLGYL